MGNREQRRDYIAAVLASPRLDPRARKLLTRIWRRHPDAIDIDGPIRTERVQ